MNSFSGLAGQFDVILLLKKYQLSRFGREKRKPRAID
jgi:hypothetical protein